MNSIIEHTFLISFMCTAALIAMLFIRKALIYHTSAWLRSFVWMLILVRMCIPATTQTPIGIMSFEPNIYPVDYAASYDYQDNESEPLYSNNSASANTQTNTGLNNYTQKKNAFSFSGLISIIYFAGFAISTLFLIIKLISQKKYIMSLEICSNLEIVNILNGIKKQIGIKRNVPILIDTNGAMPMVYGLIKPKIILPKRAAVINSSELQLIIRHELTHMKQQDIIKLWIIEICTCINWFNPLIYFIKNIITQDIELSCDEKVLANTCKSSHYEYSRIIAEYSTMQRFTPLVLSSGINPGRGKGIKTRLSLIKKGRGKAARLSGAVTAAVIVFIMTACTTINIASALPSSFDWRDEGVVTSPQDQGEYGAGSIFAAISMLESNIAISTHELVALSEQHFINETDFWSSERGVSPQIVLDFLADKGAVTDEQMPYTGIKGASSGINCSYRLPAWGSLELSDKSPDERIDEIKRYLIKYGPVITPVTLYYDLIDYKGGVYEWDESSGADCGHWLTIVGWKDDKSIEGGGYWIVKESWGTDWGEGGFAKIAYNDECGIDDYSIYYAEKPEA